MNSFSAQLATLPAIGHLSAIELHDENGQSIARIENRPGSAGSVRVYHALAARFGAISPVAAEAGLAIYAEHTADAREHPGKHPNIDRLFAIIDGRLGTLRVSEIA